MNKIQEILSEGEIDFNYSYFDDKPPLIITAQIGNVEVMKKLLEYVKPDHLNKCNNTGFTPLMAAAKFCRTGMIKFLLSQNPNVHL